MKNDTLSLYIGVSSETLIVVSQDPGDSRVIISTSETYFHFVLFDIYIFTPIIIIIYTISAMRW